MATCSDRLLIADTMSGGNVDAGGFDYTFLKPPPKHLECPVCLLVLRDPNVSDCCGNHFCRSCIEQIKLSKKPCPLCQEASFNLMLHKGVMREVNALEIKCPNGGAGCPWKGELGKVNNHLNGDSSSGCGFVEVECAFRCGRILQRRLLQEHLNDVCPKRPVEVQLSSGLRKVKAVMEENEGLKQEVSLLKQKVASLEIRHAKLEQKNEGMQKSTNREIESLKFQIKDLQTKVANKSSQDVQSIRREMEQLKLEQQAAMAVLVKKLPPKRQIPSKPIDPLNVVMVEDLKTKGVLKTERVAETMKAVDRKHYVPNPSKHYVDSPQAIGHNASISAPHMHAHTLELLKGVLVDGATVLDVGSGSGYLTTCMAYMCAPYGYAVGIDCVKELTLQAMKSIENDNPELLRHNVFMVTGDGHNGYSAKAPYDVIHVGGATPVVPQALYDQLKCGGRMIIPVGPHNGDQYLEQHDKIDGTIVKKRLMGVRYGPLLNV